VSGPVLEAKRGHPDGGACSRIPTLNWTGARAARIVLSISKFNEATTCTIFGGLSSRALKIAIKCSQAF